MATVRTSSAEAIQLNVSWREKLPTQLAGHDLLRRIGQGSYGGVWLARNRVTNAFRAIKIIWREAFDSPKPYLREYEAIKRFEAISRQHPGFVPVLQVGEIENAFYYIMEIADDRLAGGTIDPEIYSPRTIRVASRLPLDQCVDIGINLCSALQYLHSCGLIHRDIKPSNVVFIQGKPRLADIGLVIGIEEAESLVGTAGFIPPEGPISPRSDIFSLGKLLYEVATGKDRCQFPELPDDISSEQTLLLELNQIVLKACHPNPARRYASAAALGRELELLQVGRSIKRMRQLERAKKQLVFLLAGISICAAGGFFFFQQWQGIKLRRAEERERKVGNFIGRATDNMRRGDFASALPLAAGAAEADSRQENIRTHQLRIGSILANAFSATNIGINHPLLFSRDRSLFAYAENNISHIRRSSDLSLYATLPEAGGKYAFSRDNQELAVAKEGGLTILDLGSGARLFTTNFTGPVNALEFFPDKKRIAVFIENTGVYLLDRQSTNHTFLNIPDLYTVHVSRSGNYISTAGMNASCQVWDPAGRLVGEFKHGGIAYEGIFLSDESALVSCGFYDRCAVAWSLATGKSLSRPMEHEDAVVSLAISPDSQILATASLDGSVGLWSTASWAPVTYNHLLYHPERVSSVDFISNNRLIAGCTDNSNYLWDISSHAPAPRELKNKILLPDPKLIQENDLFLTTTDTEVTGKIGGTSVQITFPPKISVVAVSPDHERIAVGSKKPDLDHHSVALFTKEGRPLGISLPHRDGVMYAAFSHDGRKIVTCGEDFVALIWDATTGQRLTPPMRHKDKVAWAAFNSDDTWLATVSPDKTAIVWDALTGDPLTPPIELPERLTCVKFQDDDTLVLATETARQFEIDLPLAPLPLQQYAKRLYSPLLAYPTLKGE